MSLGYSLHPESQGNQGIKVSTTIADPMTGVFIYVYVYVYGFVILFVTGWREVPSLVWG